MTEEMAGRIRRVQHRILAASLVGFGVLTVAAAHHVVGVTARESSASSARQFGVQPAPVPQPSYQLAQPTGGYAPPVTSTTLS